ncbi:MAG: ATP-binding protein [Lachnospiraceae bacterium]|nr:ATP-binding protein [Lachnospiraceae bacterium]
METSNINDYLSEINCIGIVENVDTRKIVVSVENESVLNTIKINDIVVLAGSNSDEKLIGILTKVTKKKMEPDESEQSDEELLYSNNCCVINLVGSFYNKYGAGKDSKFKRAINTYPEINSKVYQANEPAMQMIMNAVSSKATNGKSLKIGHFASNRDVDAILDGNRFFQRHACIVGSTGSGKSYTVAGVLEKADELPHANMIVFDLHGEYNELSYADQIKICDEKDGLHIPLWFFNYEEIHSLFVESSEGSSTNQRAAVINYILGKKKEYIKDHMDSVSEEIVTADTPVPFSAKGLIEYLEEQNSFEIDTGEIYKTGDNKGQPKTKRGQYYDKLTNLITRLRTKMDDKKYGFVFHESATLDSFYLNEFAARIMGNEKHRIKVIDLSEVPSDMLASVIGIVTRIIYDIQFWMTPAKDEVRHPLVLVCDEAHIYMANDMSKMKAVEKKSLEIFEKIAKEGRKYGLGLLIVSQRPAELNTTIMSQCNNIVSLKVTNDRDKSAVAAMLTDSLVGIVDMFPNLDVGECVVVGDAIMLPSKIILDKPREKPKSATIDFWDRWYDGKQTVFDIDAATLNLIKQSRG